MSASRKKQNDIAKGIEQAFESVLRDLASEDPIDLIVLGQTAYEALLKAQADVAALRRSAVRTLRSDGWLLKDIAEQVGLTVPRIMQMERGEGRETARARRASRSTAK